MAKILPTELRLGNFILNGYDKIIEVYPELFTDFESIQKSIGDYKGIPLTEEWLLKFGFEKNGLVWVLHLKYELHDLPSTLQMWNETNEFTICRNGIYAISIECKHVHQLQNLVYALTGKELETK